MANLICRRTQALQEFDRQQRTYGGRAWGYAYPPIQKMPYQGLTSFYWCAWLYVAITLWSVGIDLRKLTRNWAYCPAVRQAFIDAPDWVRVKPGREKPWDAVLYYNGAGVFYHFGAVAHTGDGRLLYTAEGDTSTPSIPGSDSSGGVITYKTRRLSDLAATGHGVEIWRNTSMPDSVAADTLPTITLAVDGVAGDQTFTRLCQIMHATKTEYAIKYLQQQLNKAGYTGYDGKPLVVDGVGLYSNADGDTPRTNTLYALQGALGVTGTARDGRFSGGDSHAVRLWQQRLNAGHIY